MEKKICTVEEILNFLYVSFYPLWNSCLWWSGVSDDWPADGDRWECTIIRGGSYAGSGGALTVDGAMLYIGKLFAGTFLLHQPKCLQV